MFTNSKMPVRWKLRQLMSDRKMTNRALSKKVGKHANTISNLKQLDYMPKVDGEFLTALCRALECELWELIEWLPDDDAA